MSSPDKGSEHININGINAKGSTPIKEELDQSSNAMTAKHSNEKNKSNSENESHSDNESSSGDESHSDDESQSDDENSSESSSDDESSGSEHGAIDENRDEIQTIAKQIKTTIQDQLKIMMMDCKIDPSKLNFENLCFQWIEQNSQSIFFGALTLETPNIVFRINKNISFDIFGDEEIMQLKAFVSDLYASIVKKYKKRYIETDNSSCNTNSQEHDQWYYYKKALDEIHILIMQKLEEHGFCGLTAKNLGFDPIWKLHQIEGTSFSGVKINTSKTSYVPPSYSTEQRTKKSATKKGRKARKKDVPFEWAMCRYTTKNGCSSGHFTIICENTQPNITMSVYWGDQKTKKKHMNIDAFTQWYADTFNGSYNRFKKGIQSRQLSEGSSFCSDTSSTLQTKGSTLQSITSPLNTLTSDTGSKRKTAGKTMEMENGSDMDKQGVNTGDSDVIQDEVHDTMTRPQKQKKKDSTDIVNVLRQKIHLMANQMHILTTSLRLEKEKNELLQKSYDQLGHMFHSQIESKLQGTD